MQCEAALVKAIPLTAVISLTNLPVAPLTLSRCFCLVTMQNRGLDPKVASDIFRTFAKVLEHFDGKLVLNIVAYNNAAPEVYGSFAQRTGGMLMNPISRNPAVLARGLTDVVRALLGQMIDQPAEVQELEGFRLMDVSGLNPDRQTEQVSGYQDDSKCRLSFCH